MANANVFKTGKMMSDIVDAAITNGKGEVAIIDGGIVVLGDLVADSAYSSQFEYDVYEMEAPAAATDEVAIVDYAGVQEGTIGGNQYKVGIKLHNLSVPAGTLSRVRRLHLHDKFWLGAANFDAAPVVGKYATAEASKFTHKKATALPEAGYAVKILAEEDLTVGMRTEGKIYLVEVVQL